MRVATSEGERRPAGGWLPKDPGLWAFVAAMVLYHAANAPGGVYLGLFLKRDLHAPERMLAYAFAVSMVAWMLVVWPAGWLADRWGRQPLLIAGWAIMAVRLGLVALVRTPDGGRGEPGPRRPGQRPVRGPGRGVGDRPPGRPEAVGRGAGDRRHVAWCSARRSARRSSGFLVGPLGYRGLFAALAGVGAVATALVVAFVPETLARHDEDTADHGVEPMATVSDLSTTP